MEQKIRIVTDGLSVIEINVITPEEPMSGDYKMSKDKQWIEFAKKFNVNLYDRRWHDLYLRVCGEGIYEQIMKG